MPLRRFVPLIILGLLHAYIGARLLPDLATGLEVRIGGALLLVVSYALMLAGLLARSIQRRSLADRVAAAGLFAVSLFSSLFVFTLLRDLRQVSLLALQVALQHLVNVTMQAVRHANSFGSTAVSRHRSG